MDNRFLSPDKEHKVIECFIQNETYTFYQVSKHIKISEEASFRIYKQLVDQQIIKSRPLYQIQKKSIKMSQLQFNMLCSTFKGNLDFSKTVYKNINTKVLMTCLEHGDFEQSVIFIKNHTGQYVCPVCIQIYDNDRISKLNNKQYVQVANIRHKNKYQYNELTPDNQGKIEVQCPIHGVFKIRKNAHISKTEHYGCQKCGRKFSSGEEKIALWLKNKNFNYEREVSYEHMYFSKPSYLLRCDFVIPEKNTILEFDGIHHFKNTLYGSTITDYRKIKQKDLCKIFYINVLKNMNIIKIKYNLLHKLHDILSFEFEENHTKIDVERTVITFNNQSKCILYGDYIENNQPKKCVNLVDLLKQKSIINEY